MAKPRLCSSTLLKTLPIHLSMIFTWECWNTLNKAGIFLNKQEVTLNGREDLTTVCNINFFTVFML